LTKKNEEYEPTYRKLFAQGELQERASKARDALAHCTLCPHRCGVDRLQDEREGICRGGRAALVSSAFPHFGEERCLSGYQGSGTLFFGGCNLQCIFCQNYELSHQDEGRELSAPSLSRLMLLLQEKGCHNINFVTPSHVVPQILEALCLAIPEGLRLPLVYNTGGYDAAKTLAWLEGVVDIYMPDLKYGQRHRAEQLSGVADYPEVSQEAVRIMHRQVGDLQLNKEQLATRGLLIRHLVLPGGLAGTRAVMRFLATEISAETYINIMGQYHPAWQAHQIKHLNRSLHFLELEEAYQIAVDEGLHRFDEGLLGRLRGSF
jgi:putative pyruvate formate lyase activating enzyme